MGSFLFATCLFSETKYIYVEVSQGNKGKLSNLCNQIITHEDIVHTACIAGRHTVWLL